MANISSIEPYGNPEQLRYELREWINGFDVNFTHFITLSTNDPTYSMPKARAKLREWDKRMNREATGRNWSKREGHQNRWLAFPEGLQAEIHWHLLFRLSDQLPAGRTGHMMKNGIATSTQCHWKKLVPTGSTDIQRIYCNQGAIDYVTKQLKNNENFRDFVISDCST